MIGKQKSIFLWYLFLRVTFLSFRVDLISQIGYWCIFLRGFIFTYLSVMNALYIFIILLFVLQLVLCELLS